MLAYLHVEISEPAEEEHISYMLNSSVEKPPRGRTALVEDILGKRRLFSWFCFKYLDHFQEVCAGIVALLMATYRYRDLDSLLVLSRSF